MTKQPTLIRSLQLWHIFVIGVGYMAPMAVFDTFGIVSNVTKGHVPTAYLLTVAAILFTAFSYGKMVQAYPYAGSAYTYTQRTINRPLGFLVGWSALLDYLFLPMINALLTGIYMSAVFPELPQAVWIISFVMLITVINIWKINISVSFNLFLVVFQVLVALFFILLSVRGLIQEGGEFTIQPFYTEEIQLNTLLAGASILCFSFLGFDAVTTLSEETKNPTKTIPRGILLIALFGGCLFTSVSYFAQSLYPDASVFQDPEGASAEIAYHIGGILFQSIFLAAAISSTLASGIASMISSSRLLYAMGRDQVLPKKYFGYVHPRLGTPLFNVFLVGLISLSAVGLDLLLATSFINYGALIAFTFVNLSVIAYYFRSKPARTVSSFFQYLVLPLIGFSFVAIFWFSLHMHSILLGLSWTLIGSIYLLVITRFFTRPLPEYTFLAGE
ncbi:APC family permease [Hazenella coriacea]|uniref:Putrescine:proton symporter (AAT family) n=1 Tax=Hazenella coriacea TaxID=1179467 RepID=A0A4R3LAQ2_9BACL|nr:APC family permease [Hazenella coriacea]TCS96829.1 putrescine:proton symporter (AAT family) [Hazenella coriacea]